MQLGVAVVYIFFLFSGSNILAGQLIFIADKITYFFSQRKSTKYVKSFLFLVIMVRTESFFQFTYTFMVHCEKRQIQIEASENVKLVCVCDVFVTLNNRKKSLHL